MLRSVNVELELEPKADGLCRGSSLDFGGLAAAAVAVVAAFSGLGLKQHTLATSRAFVARTVGSMVPFSSANHSARRYLCLLARLATILVSHSTFTLDFAILATNNLATCFLAVGGL